MNRNSITELCQNEIDVISAAGFIEGAIGGVSTGVVVFTDCTSLLWMPPPIANMTTSASMTTYEKWSYTFWCLKKTALLGGVSGSLTGFFSGLTNKDKPKRD